MDAMKHGRPLTLSELSVSPMSVHPEGPITHPGGRVPANHSKYPNERYFSALAALH